MIQWVQTLTDEEVRKMSIYWTGNPPLIKTSADLEKYIKIIKGSDNKYFGEVWQKYIARTG